MTVPDLRILEASCEEVDTSSFPKPMREQKDRASVPIPPQPILLWTSRILEPGPVGSGFSVPKKDVAHGSQRRTDSGALRSLAVECPARPTRRTQMHSRASATCGPL